MPHFFWWLFGGTKAARIAIATAQAAQQVAQLKVQLPNVEFDTDKMFDPAQPTRLTARTGGTYLVIGEIQWAANGSGYRSASIMKTWGPNFGVIGSVLGPPLQPPAATSQNVSTLTQLGVGDYVELVAMQSSAGPVNVEPYGTYLMAARLGP
jgi:hypothetical protein